MIDIDRCPYGYESYDRSPWAEFHPQSVAKPTMELRFNVVRDVNSLDTILGHRLEQRFEITTRGTPAGYEWRPVPTNDPYALKKKN